MAQPELECVYCGSREDLTKDHIPPKCMFAERYHDLIRVNSCASCNQSASKDDEYFRDRLAMRIDANKHPDVKKIMPDVFRSFNRQEARGKKQALLDSVVIKDAYTPAGIYLGVVGGATPEYDRLERVVARIVRGLYWHKYRVRLPDDYEVQSCIDTDLSVHDQNTQASILSFYGPIVSQPPDEVIGNGVFTYWIESANDDAFVTACVLRFYNSVFYLCKTMPKE